MSPRPSHGIGLMAAEAADPDTGYSSSNE